MSALLLILLAIVIFVVAYLTYGRYLAKTWGIDPSRKTPAIELEDGVDYCPAKTPVLMGHHFSSMPVQALSTDLFRQHFSDGFLVSYGLLSVVFSSVQFRTSVHYSYLFVTKVYP